MYKGKTMSIAIRIGEKFYNIVKKAARAEYRSIPHQIKYWAMLGKCASDNPDLPIDFIKDILIAKNTDKSLTEPFEFE